MGSQQLLDGKEPVNRARRAAIVVSVLVFCLVVPTVFVAISFTHPFLQQLIDGLLGIASGTILAYLTGSVIDRSNVLGKIGDGFSTRRRPYRNHDERENSDESFG